MDLIYLDNNATTQVPVEVVEAMAPYWSQIYMNPASLAGDVTGASRPLQEAKAGLAFLLGASAEEFFLTAGATEANNWVLQSVVRRSLRVIGKCHLIVSAIEHPSVMETAKALARENPSMHLDSVSVDEDGVILLDELDYKVTPETTLLSIILANNETGVIQPVAQAAKIAKDRCPQCLVHTDATQAVGKLQVSLEGELTNVDFLSLSGHKFHGPKGIGALFVRNGLQLEPLLRGGSQQGGQRAGTEVSPLASGLAKAISLLGEDDALQESNFQIQLLRDYLEEELRRRNLGIRLLGSASKRLSNTSLLLLPKMEGEMAVCQLLEDGIVSSTGAACSTGADTPSHVVTAMGVPFSEARNVLRLSLSAMTKKEEIDIVISALERMIREIT